MIGPVDGSSAERAEPRGQSAHHGGVEPHPTLASAN